MSTTICQSCTLRNRHSTKVGNSKTDCQGDVQTYDIRFVSELSFLDTFRRQPLPWKSFCCDIRAFVYSAVVDVPGKPKVTNLYYIQVADPVIEDCKFYIK